MMESFSSGDCPVICITGGRHSGKTTWARAVAAKFRSYGCRCAGVLERARYDVTGECIGYDFEDISTGECEVLARHGIARTGDLSCGRYVFRAHAFARAVEKIRLSPGGSVCFLDELGHLELSGSGLWSGVEQWRVRRDLSALVVVCREEYCSDFESSLGGFSVKIFMCDGEGYICSH